MKAALSILASLAVALSAAGAQKPPDTVFLEDLTWVELRDLIRGGTTTVILATAGTEQKGPHMVIGEHKYILEYTTNRIARALGNAVVAPIITYVPEGSWETPRGHMAKAGTITLPNDRFMVLLEHAAKSLAKGGFRNVILIGDSGGNQNGLRDVAAKLNAEWSGSGTRAHFIGDYYTKANADARKYIIDKLGVTNADIGSHAGMLDTSELMFVNPRLVRLEKRQPNGGSPTSGVNGDPTKATAELGEAILRIKIDNALAQIRASLAAPTPPMEHQP
jgi:creatinine amidohydrolase/Fe(II)-dependent formamide hydrolase-like protein